MIDEAFLDKIVVGRVCLIPKEGVCAPICHEYGRPYVCDCEMIELVRLARLGLWASSVGIPAIQDSVSRSDDVADSWCSKPIREALTKIPKDKT